MLSERCLPSLVYRLAPSLNTNPAPKPRAPARATSPVNPQTVGSVQEAIWTVRSGSQRVSHPLSRQPGGSRIVANPLSGDSRASLSSQSGRRGRCVPGHLGAGEGPSGPGDPGAGGVRARRTRPLRSRPSRRGRGPQRPRRPRRDRRCGRDGSGHPGAIPARVGAPAAATTPA